MPGAASIAARALPGIVIGQEETITVTMGASSPAGTYGFNIDTFDDFGSVDKEFAEGGPQYAHNYWQSAKALTFKKFPADGSIRQRFRYYDYLIDGDPEPYFFNYPNATWVQYSPATGIPTGAQWRWSLGSLQFDRSDPTGWTVGTGTRNVRVRKQAILTTRIVVTKGTSDTDTYIGFDEANYTEATATAFGSLDIDVINGVKIRGIVFEEGGANDTMHLVIDGKWSGLPDAYGAGSPFLGMNWQDQNSSDTPAWSGNATYNAGNNTTTFKFGNQSRSTNWATVAANGGVVYVDLHTPHPFFTTEFVRCTQATWIYLTNNHYGYSSDPNSLFSGAKGSIIQPTLKGPDGAAITIEEAFYVEDTQDTFELTILGEVAQDYLYLVAPEGGPIAGYVTAGADTYVSSGGYTTWRWNAVLVPTEWDGVGPVSVLLEVKP